MKIEKCITYKNKKEKQKQSDGGITENKQVLQITVLSTFSF